MFKKLFLFNSKITKLTAKKEKRYPVKNAVVLSYETKIKLLTNTSVKSISAKKMKYLKAEEKYFSIGRNVVSIPIKAPMYIPVHLEQTKKYEPLIE